MGTIPDSEGASGVGTSPSIVQLTIEASNAFDCRAPVLLAHLKAKPFWSTPKRGN